MMQEGLMPGLKWMDQSLRPIYEPADIAMNYLSLRKV